MGRRKPETKKDDKKKAEFTPRGSGGVKRLRNHKTADRERQNRPDRKRLARKPMQPMQ